MVSPVGAIEERVKKLHETVALSQDQQEKLKAILTKNDAAMTAAIAAWRTGHTPEDRQKLRDLLNAQNAAIRSLLTEAQKQKGQTAAAQTGIGGGGGPAGARVRELGALIREPGAGRCGRCPCPLPEPRPAPSPNESAPFPSALFSTSTRHYHIP